MQNGAKGWGQKGCDEKNQWDNNKSQMNTQNKGTQWNKGSSNKGFGKKGAYSNGKGKGGKSGKGWSTYGVWDEESWDDSALFLCSFNSGGQSAQPASSALGEPMILRSIAPGVASDPEPQRRDAPKSPDTPTHVGSDLGSWGGCVRQHSRQVEEQTGREDAGHLGHRLGNDSHPELDLDSELFRKSCRRRRR